MPCKEAEVWGGGQSWGGGSAPGSKKFPSQLQGLPAFILLSIKIP
jgi:hypothetical protein